MTRGRLCLWTSRSSRRNQACGRAVLAGGNRARKAIDLSDGVRLAEVSSLGKQLEPKEGAGLAGENELAERSRQWKEQRLRQPAEGDGACGRFGAKVNGCGGCGFNAREGVDVCRKGQCLQIDYSLEKGRCLQEGSLLAEDLRVEIKVRIAEESRAWERRLSLHTGLSLATEECAT